CCITSKSSREPSTHPSGTCARTCCSPSWPGPWAWRLPTMCLSPTSTTLRVLRSPMPPDRPWPGRSPRASSGLAISWTRRTGRWSAASRFPMGHWPSQTTPPHPVVSTLQSDATAFYTTTSISGYRWTYVVLFNLAEDTREYQLDLRPFLRGAASVVYDYRAGEQVAESQLLSGFAGELQSGEYRYWVIAPQARGLYLLGFLDKYVTMSGRQVQRVATDLEGVTIEMELPAGRPYTFVVIPAGDRFGDPRAVSGRGTQGHAVKPLGGLTGIDFWVDSPR